MFGKSETSADVVRAGYHVEQIRQPKCSWTDASDDQLAGEPGRVVRAQHLSVTVCLPGVMLNSRPARRTRETTSSSCMRLTRRSRLPYPPRHDLPEIA